MTGHYWGWLLNTKYYQSGVEYSHSITLHHRSRESEDAS